VCIYIDLYDVHLEDTLTKTTIALIFRWPRAKCTKVTQNK